MYASTGTATGAWQPLADLTAAGGTAMWNPDAAKAKIAPALASPANFFEINFSAMKGAAYHIWVRMRAQNNSLSNDSVHIQFSDTVTELNGAAPVMRIGSTSSAEFVLQDGPSGAGDSGWGWADNGWGTPGNPIYFETTGTHRLRVQQREDGAIVDQIVISPTTYFVDAPGPRRNDATILPATPPNSGPCTYTLSSAGSSIATGGGTGSVNVATQSGCAWTASTTASWITVTSAASSSGNGTVAFTVSANSGAARSGTITIAQNTYTVSQDAVQTPSCSVTLSPTSATAGAGAGSGSVTVTASDPSCAWSATTTAGWIAVTGGSSGTGNGTVTYSVQANPGAARIGTLSIKGKTFTITQDATSTPPGSCAVTLDKTSMFVGAPEANWTINVTAASTCAWTVSSDAGWLVVTSTSPTAQPVSGNGSVRVRAVTNTSPRRVGHFTINGVIYTVTQSAGAPTP
jgi:hypothetical protein